MNKYSLRLAALAASCIFSSASLHAGTRYPLNVYPQIIGVGGPTWQDIVDYKGTQGVSVALLNERARSVGMLRFNDNFGSVTPNNLAGIGLCSGTLISKNQF
ncbi:MAG TPA: hypothetical protein PKD17_12610, partial [Cellvibrionaceae bacterium]|nr:hypothetical protein [Cellvibrionaceae bacterium]